MSCAGREQLHDLGGVKGPAAACRADAARRLVERLERLGGRVLHLDRYFVAGRHVEPQDSVTDAVFLSEASLYRHQFEPQSGCPGRHALDERADLVGIQLDHRPRVQQDAVPHQPPVQGPWSLEGANCLQYRHHHALELRQCNDATSFVADGGEVADLCQREQPLILGVGARDPSEHVDVLGRRKAL